MFYFPFKFKFTPIVNMRKLLSRLPVTGRRKKNKENDRYVSWSEVCYHELAKILRIVAKKKNLFGTPESSFTS